MLAGICEVFRKTQFSFRKKGTEFIFLNDRTFNASHYFYLPILNSQPTYQQLRVIDRYKNSDYQKNN
jgi:hypothetical protein